MLHWLAILAAVAAALGAQAAPLRPPARGAEANDPAARIALWLAGSLVLAALLTTLAEQAIPSDKAALYRPLLAGLAGALATVGVGTFTLRRIGREAAHRSRALAPLVNVPAAGWSWLLLSNDTLTVAAWIGLNAAAAALCATFVIAGASFRDRGNRHEARFALSLGIVLLALSALATIG